MRQDWKRKGGFKKSVREAAWERCGGKCEGQGCGQNLGPHNPANFDHIVPKGLGGKDTLENCQVLGAKCCHVDKTTEQDRPAINKADRLYAKHNGLFNGRGW